MHLDLIESISLAGRLNVANDDRAGSAERHAWVIDGATDLGPAGLLGARGGAAWLADTAHRAFAAANGSLTDICAQVFDTVAGAYEGERRREPLAGWELPRAAFAAVAIEGDSLVCGFMADCIVLHRSAAGIAFLTPQPDRERERAEAAALGPGTGAAAVRSPEVLADRRAARERPKAVLGIDAGHARINTEYVRVPVAQGDDLLLLSDGFAALFDTYQAYDPAGFVAQVLQHGLAPLARQLRDIERQDAACLRYPRFKASDDATGLWLRVG
ncbi:protein phosphatase 2C domain-containing protein [Pseudomonas sp. 21LCFQ010]|uniref:protein phosphatase 2C domain-containing protein n=1 Tax=Pseudomonas sp. 21LCFQ010 TaxID=2957506 RepID=UPI002097628E|nr:protein phosphatase 2C domain-containing protein [Pseudomonas sp. 21LCFQ010]MCO8161236.1 protein phosphatase 2C domain-containing protein [Pseudomonas sp. 21LCFQ010]